MNLQPGLVAKPSFTNPGFSDGFPDVDISLLVSDTVSYTDTVTFKQQPVVDSSLYVWVEEPGLLMAQL